jgi:hypothetical protein
MELLSWLQNGLFRSLSQKNTGRKSTSRKMAISIEFSGEILSQKIANSWENEVFAKLRRRRARPMGTFFFFRTTPRPQ